MVPEKRKLMVVGAAIAAAFAVSGCAPAGYDAADYGNATEPAADTAGAATPDPSSTEDPIAAADPSATSGADANADTELPEDQVTNELVGTSVARMGKVIENEDGYVLYRFDDDTEGKSNCNGDCAKIWPPALTNDGKPELKGVSADLVGTITRADGTKQLTIKGNPVYTYIGDTKPASWKGQNVSGKWFVIQPNGNKNLTCLPAVSKPVAPPADGDESAAGGDYSY